MTPSESQNNSSNVVSPGLESIDATLEDGEEDKVPGDGDAVDDRSHYYWQLATPELYQSAGAAGMHWRAIKYPKEKWLPYLSKDVPTDFNGVGWLNEVRWRSYCEKKTARPLTIAVYVKIGNKLVAKEALTSTKSLELLDDDDLIKQA